MGLEYIHLSLNHVAVLGIVFGFFVLLAGFVARSKGATRVGLALLAISAIFAIPVYFTGETAEEVVENLPGFSDAITEQHESSAVISFGLAIFSGCLAVVALAFSRGTSKLSKLAVMATLVISFVTGVAMVRTANLGGQIRHTEIRSGAKNTDSHVTGTDKGKTIKAEKDDDD